MGLSLPADVRCLYSAVEVDAAVDRVAVRMAVRLWDAQPIVVCVMQGGLPFTADLLRRFYFDLELDYVHATRYHGVAGGNQRFLRPLQRSVAGRTVLLVDDVVDEGVTLGALRDAVAAQGARQVLTAVLVRKAVPNALAAVDYAALEAPDEFLVGRGMDCSGAFRQLSGIYALPPHEGEQP